MQFFSVISSAQGGIYAFLYYTHRQPRQKCLISTSNTHNTNPLTLYFSIVDKPFKFVHIYNNKFKKGEKCYGTNSFIVGSLYYDHRDATL